MENLEYALPVILIENPIFNLFGSSLKDLIGFGGSLSVLIFGIAFLAFFIISAVLLYHWLKYGKGVINRLFIVPLYFGGSLIFLGSALVAAFSI